MSEINLIPKNYLNKYCLSDIEYSLKWDNIQSSIFVPEFLDFATRRKFQDRFKNIIIPGGQIFGKRDFDILLSCMKNAGDDKFVIIENRLYYDEFIALNAHMKDFTNFLKLEFPTSITWEELQGQKIFEMDLLNTSIREFYVFGDSGKWGKYCANDIENPVEIIGFLPMLENVFSSLLSDVSDDQLESMKETLPDFYQDGFYKQIIKCSKNREL